MVARGLTTRDRHARNLVEAQDFTTRREAIDLPRFDPPPARACAVGGGWLELNASRDGLVKIVCEGSPDAACSARLVALEGELQLARAPVRKFGRNSKLILELKLTKQARALLASGRTGCRNSGAFTRRR
jgi:hypothetical protein